MIKKRVCPCRKKNCERRGKCDECRKHHAESEPCRSVYCERGKERRNEASFLSGECGRTEQPSVADGRICSDTE